MCWGNPKGNYQDDFNFLIFFQRQIWPTLNIKMIYMYDQWGLKAQIEKNVTPHIPPPENKDIDFFSPTIA